MTPPAISVEKLRRSFRRFERAPGVLAGIKSLFWRTWTDVHAVQDVSFEIPEGGFVGFLGPNGAGKTTTLKMLSGILTPTDGTCSVLGFTPHERRHAFKKQIGLVMGQKSQLIWDLPPTDSFLLHRDLYEIPDATWKADVTLLAERLRVTHVLSTPVRQLSLGERMKCELLLSLLHRPRVLFLDEPTIGLDITSQIHLWEFLGTYQQLHPVTVLLTSHYVQDIANLCERVIILNAGTKVYDGGFDALIERMEPEREGVLRVRRNDMQESHRQHIAAMVKQRHLEEISPDTFRIHAPRAELSHITETLLRTLPVEELRMEEVNMATALERAFAMRLDD